MKLASLANGGRDGRLILVDRDLSHAVAARAAATLQAALDDWAATAPALETEYKTLLAGAAQDTFAFDPADCMAPLPRAYQWADGSAYLNHVELVRRARGAEMPDSFRTDPLLYQGGSDAFLGARDPIRLADEAWGIDFEGEVAVVTDDVPMGATPQAAAGLIRLVMLVNDVSLRNLIPGEMAKGFGFFQSKPSSAFSPVAATPDELGAAWRDCKPHLALLSFVNGEAFGWPEAGEDMTFDFARLIAHAAMTRRLGAGCIVGSGTVSNSRDGVGYSCIAEARVAETLATGKPRTPFLKFGDRVRIEMTGGDGRSIFGAIEQTVERHASSTGLTGD